MTQKVVFATISLHNMAGGLEKNIVRIANYCASVGKDTHMVTFDQPGATAFFDLHPSITWHQVGRTPPHTKITFMERLRLMGRIRNAVRTTSSTNLFLVIFHHGILLRFLLASFGLGAKIICSERNSLSLYNHIRRKKWNVNFAMLALANRITVQIPSYKYDYPAFLQNKIVTAPNAVDPVMARAKPDQPNINGRFTVVAVGRLCDQKNYAALLNAFHKIYRAHPNWDLMIVGNGDYDTKLKKLTTELGIQNQTIFVPNTKNISDILMSCHLYCMPSKWEGFPNALAEAMAHGLPCVGYAGCAGVRDLIDDNTTGLLAAGNGDVDTLAVALDRMMTNDLSRAQYGQAGVMAMTGYTPDRIYEIWEGIFDDSQQ